MVRSARTMPADTRSCWVPVWTSLILKALRSNTTGWGKAVVVDVALGDFRRLRRAWQRMTGTMSCRKSNRQRRRIRFAGRCEARPFGMLGCCPVLMDAYSGNWQAIPLVLSLSFNRRLI
jgi:hypothetical protein